MTRELVHDQRRADVVAAAAAVLLGHEHAERADLAQPPEEVAREPVLRVDARGDRRELFLGQTPNGVANQLVFGGEVHQDDWKIVSSGRRIAESGPP